MKKLFTNFKISILPILIIALFFSTELIHGRVPIPADSLIGLYHPFRDNSYLGFAEEHFPTKNPLITDPVLQTYPWRFLVVNNLKNFSLPLWNPYSFSGQPLLANVQSATFQIINLLYLKTPFNFVWVLGVIIAPLLTSLFTFFFLRSLKISQTASAFSSFILPFTGFFTAWLAWGTVITTAMWLPLILYCVNKLNEKWSARFFILLTFSSFQTIVSGHWQTAFYVMLSSAIYLIYKSISSKSLKLFSIVTSGLILGAMISSIQIIPSLEFINLSNRGLDQAYFAGRRDWFIPLQNLAQLLAPDFFGNPTTYNYWGIWNYAEFVSYIGLVPLFFALISVFKKNSYIKFFWFMIALSLFLALENPISKLPYTLNLPLIASMQPSRIIFLLDFALSVLCAFGMDYFLEEKFKKKFVLPALLMFLIIISLILLTKFASQIFPSVENLAPSYTAFRNLLYPLLFSASIFLIILLKVTKTTRNLMVAIIILITVLDLFKFANKFTPFSNFSIIFPKTETTNFLMNQKKPFRILETDRRILNGNISSVYQIEQVSGYDPLYLKSYGQLVASWDAAALRSSGSFNRIVTPQNYNLPLTNFMNVKYLLSFDDIQNDNLSKIFEEGQTKIYENKNVLPRTYFVEKVTKVENQNQELSQITSKNFDFSNLAVSREFQMEGKSKGTANIIFYADQKLQIETKTQENLPLIISNVKYPGWNAFIDGRPTKLYEANFMFQSIIVPPGEHIILLSYMPKSFTYGFYLTALSVFVTICIGGFLWKKGYR